MAVDIVAADTLHMVTAVATSRHMADAAELTSEYRSTPAAYAAELALWAAVITAASGTAPDDVGTGVAGGLTAWAHAGERRPSALFGYVVEKIGTKDRYPRCGIRRERFSLPPGPAFPV
jgi:hypothetical protein